MPHAYVAEPIDIDDLETLFTSNWDTRTNSEIPLPVFATSDIVRFDPMTAAPVSVNITHGEITEDQDGYAYQHVRRRMPVTIDFWTRRESASAGGVNRQFMHDVKQELRRIIYANKHSLTNWQIIRYRGFREIFEDSVAVRFHGQITLELESSGQDITTETVDDDFFNRADAAIGAEWTDVAGTWEVVSNRAALQSATANAHTRFVGSTLKANVRLEVQVITSASMDAGLLFHWQDDSNYWVVRLVESGGARFVRLFENVAASFTQMMEYRASSDAFDWTAGDQVELAVDLTGPGITVTVNGAVIFRREDTLFQAETDHGLYSNSDQLTRFDNFIVFESGGSNR